MGRVGLFISLVVLCDTLSRVECSSVSNWCLQKYHNGTHALIKHCRLYDHVEVASNSLTINGLNNSMGDIYRIYRIGFGDVSKHRLFTITNGGMLTVTKVRLSGGDVSGVVSYNKPIMWGGGAVFISGPGTLLSATDCMFYRNKAYSGGSIYAENGAKVLLENSLLEGMTTTGSGGGWWCGFQGTQCTSKGISERTIGQPNIETTPADNSRSCTHYAACSTLDSL